MEKRPKFTKGMFGFAMMLACSVVAIFLTAKTLVGFYVGIPMLVYGIYGLVTKKTWQMGGLEDKDGRVLDPEKVSFILSAAYIFLGICMSLVFGVLFLFLPALTQPI